MRARLTDTGSAPLAALTQACQADVSDIWDSFTDRLRSEGRRPGISRPLVPQTGRIFLLACAITALIGLLTVVGEARLTATGAASAVIWQSRPS